MRRLAAILAALALPLVVLAPMSSAEATLTARYVADAGNRAYADAFVVAR